MLEKWSFLVEAIILLSYIPITYLAYRRLREPRKQRRAVWELSQVAEPGTSEFDEALSTARYEPQEYLLPVLYITVVFAALYGMTHPAVIATGVWSGLLKVDLSALQDLGEQPAIIQGRFLFWCWLGAYVYSVERTVRHYLAYDLNPSVYISAAKRFIIAFVIGAVLSVGFVVLSDVDLGAAGANGAQAKLLSTDTRLVLVYIVAFVSGIFPERGMRWIVATAARAMGSNGKQPEDEQRSLSEIEGISYWHRGRLEDEGVENIQNLATAHLLTLIVRTPYDVGQLVDWVDQAILATYATKKQCEKLRRLGVLRASDVLRTARETPQLLTGRGRLREDEVKLLQLSLSSAANMKPIWKFRAQAEVETETAAAQRDMQLAVGASQPQNGATAQPAGVLVPVPGTS